MSDFPSSNKNQVEPTISKIVAQMWNEISVLTEEKAIDELMESTWKIL